MRPDTDEAHTALLAWGRWAESVLTGLGWPRENAIHRIIKLGIRGAAATGGVRLTEADSLSELVDRAVSRLDSVEREVIYRTYVGPSEAAQVTAQKCHLTYQYYRHLLSRARRRVADFLEGAKCLA